MLVDHSSSSASERREPTASASVPTPVVLQDPVVRRKDPVERSASSRDPVPPAALDVYGIGGAVPDAVAQLLQAIPPPLCFEGPFVVVDEFLRWTAALSLPEPTAPPPADANLPASKTRKRRNASDDESDIVATPLAIPDHDVYRQRLHRRVQQSGGVL